MSSSNSTRGGGRFGYQGSKDWINSSKSRRKNFYSSSSTAAAAAEAGSAQSSNTTATPSTEASSLPNLSRRDFKSNGPGSSSLTHLKDLQPTRNGSSYSSNYYSNLGYGGYDNGLYRSDGWRKASGESRRLVGSQKPTLSGSSSGSLTSTSSPASGYKNGRYDSYTTDPSTYGPSRWKSGRSFAASSTRYSAKDRIRNGKPSLSNPYLPNSNSVPLGSSSTNSPDSFAPSSNAMGYKYYDSSKAYGSYYSSSYSKDKSSSLSQLRPPFSNPRHYKSRYGGRYGGSTLINPAEKRAKEKELEGEQDSQNDFDDNDDVDSNSNFKRNEDDTQSEVTENEERDIEIKERIARENNVADERQDEILQQAIEEKLVETSAEPELKEDSLNDVYLKKVRIETPPVIAEVDTKVKIEYDETSATDGSEDVYRYPLPEIPYKYEELKREFQQLGRDSLKYQLATPIETFFDYPFIITNYEDFHKRKRAVLTNILRERNKNIQNKTSDLLNEYNKMLKKWEERRLKMEQQLRVLHPADDEMRRELDSSDLRKQNQQQASVGNTTNTSPHVSSLDLPTVSSRRSSRRHGDLVTTEAEFQEILLTLGQQQEDPLLKAQRVAADIPDMILDPVENKEIKFMDCNNIVKDRHAWAKRVDSDFHNTFSEKEHELFTEAFCLFPKRFGAISRYMGGLRTSAECVLHYYMTKKSVNYKQLLIQRRKTSKKSKRVKGAGRPKSTPQQSAAQVEGYVPAPNSAVSELNQEMASTDLGTPSELETPGMTPVAEVLGVQVEGGRKKRAIGSKTAEKRKPKTEHELNEDGQKPTEKKRRKTTKKPVLADGASKPEKKKRVNKKQAAEEAFATSGATAGVPVSNPDMTKVSIGALALNYPANIVQSEMYTGSAPINQQYVYQQLLQEPGSQLAQQQYLQQIDGQKAQSEHQYEQQFQYQQQNQQQQQQLQQQQQQQHLSAQYQAQYQASYQSQLPSFAPQRSAPVFPSIRNLLSEQEPSAYQQVNYAPQQPQLQLQLQLQQQQSLPPYQQSLPHSQSSTAQQQSHRKSSIMSLLNSDDKPAAVSQQRVKTNLRDLLN